MIQKMRPIILSTCISKLPKKRPRGGQKSKTKIAGVNSTVREPGEKKGIEIVLRQSSATHVRTAKRSSSRVNPETSYQTRRSRKLAQKRFFLADRVRGQICFSVRLSKIETISKSVPRKRSREKRWNSEVQRLTELKIAPCG
jgi:hypothetical protein